MIGKEIENNNSLAGRNYQQICWKNSKGMIDREEKSEKEKEIVWKRIVKEWLAGRIWIKF